MKSNKSFILFLVLAFTLPLFNCTSVEESNISKEETYGTLDEALEAKLKKASNGNGLSFFTMPSETDYASIPQDPNNKISKEKVTLGQLLFHESAIGINPRKLAQAGTYSCASCHHAAAGFQAGIRQGVGEGGLGFGKAGEGRKIISDYGFDFLDIQPIRTPTVLNTAWQEVMLWNGQLGNTPINKGTEAKWALRSPKALNFLGFQGLEIQAMAGLIIHRQRVNAQLVEKYPEYKALFDKAFPDYPENRRYTDTIAGLAIAAYERTMITNQAPFQKWLQGDKDALTEEEKKGAILFFDKAACVNCHTGPALSSNQFHALGMKDLIGEGVTNTVGQDFFTSAEGRGGFTGKAEELYQFKVPTLYNLADVSFYGHGGSFSTVRSVVEYKNLAQAENEIVSKAQLSKQFKPLNLSQEEIDQITAFLERGLRDPNLWRYVPNRLPSGNCFPNNDDISKADLGCQ